MDRYKQMRDVRRDIFHQMHILSIHLCIYTYIYTGLDLSGAFQVKGIKGDSMAMTMTMAMAAAATVRCFTFFS